MTFLSWKNMFTDCSIPFFFLSVWEGAVWLRKGSCAVWPASFDSRDKTLMNAIHFEGTAIPTTLWRRKKRNYLLESPVILLYRKFMRKQCNILCFVIYSHDIFQDTGACGLLEKYQEVILQHQQLFSRVTPSKHISFTLWLLPEVRGARRNKVYQRARVKAQGGDVTDITKLKCRALFKDCRRWKKAP